MGTGYRGKIRAPLFACLLGLLAVVIPAACSNPSSLMKDTWTHFDQKQSPVPIVSGAVAIPVFTPAAGVFSADQNVSIGCATPGTSFYYATDGSTPTTASTLYAGPILVAGNGMNETIRVLAVKAGFVDASASSSYEINYSQVSTPNFSPVAGSYGADQLVTITCATSGAVIHFTTDGTTPTAGSAVFSTAIPVAGNGASLTIKAMATKSMMTDSPVASALITITYGQASSPNYSPAGGTYSSGMFVSLSSPSPGTTIRYTTDGSTPSSTVGTPSSTLFVGAGMTIKAIAYGPTYSDSTVSSATYNFSVSPPSFSPGSGVYPSAQSVTISTTTAGASIRYTTDGVTTPTSSVGTLYAGPVNVTANTTLRAIAYKAGWTDSTVNWNSYSIMAATPTMSPTGGPLGHSVPVTLTCATAGVTIAYTLDGTSPTESGGTITHGTLYSGPFLLPYGNTTVNAIAFRTDMLDSATASGIFSEPVYLYATSNAGGSLLTRQVNLVDGSLSPVGTQGVSGIPLGVAADPLGRFLFVANSSPAWSTAYTINPASGAATQVDNQGSSFLQCPVVERSGKYLYVSTSTTNGIAGYTINQSTGAIPPIAIFSAVANTAGLAVSPVADFLYAALSNGSAIQGYSINPANGQLTSIGTFPSALGTYSVVVDPSGRFLYASNQSGGRVTAFTIDAGTGALASNGWLSSGNPIAVTVDPSGKYLYAADYSGNVIYGFTINTVDGTISPMAGSPYPDPGETNPVSLSVEPSGKYLYVVHGNSHDISAFQVNSVDGTLSARSTYDTGLNLSGVTTTGVAQ